MPQPELPPQANWREQAFCSANQYPAVRSLFDLAADMQQVVDLELQRIEDPFRTIEQVFYTPEERDHIIIFAANMCVNFCPVRTECLDDFMSQPEDNIAHDTGVQGGLTPVQIRDLRGQIIDMENDLDNFRIQ